jgi:hypothetical protein
VSDGATWTNKGGFQLTLVYSNPVYNTRAGDASGWVARGRNDTGQSREFTVQVLCGKKSVSRSPVAAHMATEPATFVCGVFVSVKRTTA